MKKLFLFLLLIPALCWGQMKHTITSFGGITECHVFTPKVPGEYPAVLWLHGLNGGWSKDSGGVGQQVANGLEIPYVIYAPQNPNQGDWSKNELANLVTIMAMGNHRLFIVTGHSQGAIGTIAAMNHFTAFWYAGGICAGQTNITDYAKFTKIHIRAWHAESDPVVGNSIFKFIPGIAAAGGDATLIKYPGITHSISGKAYSTSDPNSFWKWVESILPKPEPVPLVDSVKAQWIQSDTLKLKTKSGKVYTLEVNQLE